MWKRKQVPRIILIFCSVAALACFGKPAAGQGEDPPGRVARLAYAQGSVSFEPAGTDDWVAPGVNRPMTIGDKIWADNDGRAELQLDGSVIRISNNTGFSFLNLNDNVTQIQLTAGTVLIRVRRLDRDETYEIDTPNLAFSVMRPGVYRINVNENGDETALSVRSGEGEVTGGGAAYNVHANDSYVFSGTDQLYANREPPNEDQFEAWASMRDRRWASSRSANYVSEDVIGYEDLDEYGSWRDVPDYGGVWFPRVETADWAPYHYGHWCYVEPWGYTWVDDEPWGFAPFHYGRWVHYEGLWGWVPAPRHVERAEYIRPVYSPALVAWVGGGAIGASIGWFPLGPREVYVPSYPVSRGYVDRVNVTNTTVNTTVINNYYNTTVVNQNTNVKYVNREVPGAIAATTPQAFTAAQPVARNRVQVNANAVASAPVRATAPPVAPVKQTVLGNVPARARPPATVQTRSVVAKSTPPPPAPAVDQRLAAVQKNGGKPLSMAQMRQMAPPATAQPHPAVRVVSAAKPSATPPPAPPNRAAQPANPPSRPAPNAPASKPPNATPPSNSPADRPPTATPPPARPNQPAEHPATPPANPSQPARPAERQPAQPPAHNAPTQPSSRNDRPPNAAPVHPNEEPAPARTTPPPSNNPAMNQQHEKEQEQLRARQEQERQQLQKQQEQEHAKAAQQEANQAQRQQMEQRHQQQTQQQQQRHAQEQQQQKQQQDRQSHEKKKPEPPPEPKH